MEIIDAHHHLWDVKHLRYSLFDANPTLNRSFTVDQFEPLAQALGVQQSVCVEAASAGPDGLAEIQWLLEQTRQSQIVTRLVAWAPLERADRAGYFDQLDALNDGRIIGVRRSFELEPPDFPGRVEVITGAKLAAARGYSVDLVLYHRSLRSVLDLVRACPEVHFVLDHLGKPGVRDGMMSPWREQIAQLAAMENVDCKISGLATEAEHESWTPEQLKPYIEHVIACFGYERVMFGSDWPVCLVAGGYERSLRALAWAVENASDEQKRHLFAATARRVYRMDEQTRF
jgi:L-fuconolactonase